MIKAVLEPKLNPYFMCNQLLSAGTLVKPDSANAGYVIPCNVGDVALGFLAQDVVDPTINNFKLTSVTHKAGKGVDHVGVYFGDGSIVTDMFSGNVAIGASLYVGAGVLSTVASGNIVGIAETAGNSASGNTIRVRVIG